MLEVNGKTIDTRRFPDGTQLLKAKLNMGLEYKIKWFYESDVELVTLIYITKHLRNHGAEYIELYMPYIPNARMDRVKSAEEIFTLKYFADTINWLGFNKVRVLDPHSYVSEALLNNLVLIDQKKIVDSVIQYHIGTHKKVTLFFPDAGACKRYSGLSAGRPYLYGEKNRDWETGEIKGLEIIGDHDNVKNRNILIVDDICSKGGTFYHSAKKLKELGANEIYLYVSHCENSIFQGELLESDLIKKIYTTNSIFTGKHEKVEVIAL